ncbi:RDD family protein [Paenibacillus aurantiacus]|uniref:RDD family protein n=1 Tax=Paenibacillus aurantiacus TaxID=1936118 RepID=A0ABV5KUY1_9BACL
MDHRLPQAPLWKRAGAFLLDHFLILVVALGVGILLLGLFGEGETSFFGAASFAPIMIVAFILYLCKDIVGGRSVGKRIFGLAVLEEGGQPPKAGRRILRNAFTFLLPAELFFLLLSRSKRKIGDRLMRTDVYALQRKRPVTGIIAAVVASFAFVAFAMFASVITIMKQDSSYRVATDYIRQQAEIQRVAGEPITFGLLPTGSVSYTNGSGEAAFNLKARGSLRTVEVRISLTKAEGEAWVVRDMQYSP